MKTGLKIMREKNNITDEEIFSRMDFDKLLEMRNRQVAARSRKIRIGVGILVLSLVTFFVSFVFIRNSGTNEKAQPFNEIRSGVTPGISKQPEILKGPPVEQPVIQREAPKLKSESKTEEKPKPATGYKEALPRQGYDQLFKFFEQNLQYPPVAKVNKIEGTVMIEFYINAEGKPKEIVIVKSISHELNDEAIRLITIMPAWDPATYDGNKISTKIVLPLTFKLDK